VKKMIDAPMAFYGFIFTRGDEQGKWGVGVRAGGREKEKLERPAGVPGRTSRD
jgi:hypothetical protein